MSPKKIPQSLIDAIKKHPERVTAKSISLDKNIISGKGIKKNNEMISIKKAPIKMKITIECKSLNKVKIKCRYSSEFIEECFKHF